MVRSRPAQKSTFSYLLPFIILVIVFGGGFFAFRTWIGMQQNQAKIEEVTPTATLSFDSGKVEVKLVDTSAWNPATPDMTLYTGDSLRTFADTTATIVYFDGSITRLAPNSELLISELSRADNQKNTVSLYLQKGEVWARVIKVLNENSIFEIETPTVIASAKGTAYTVLVELEMVDGEEQYQTTVRVFESQVALQAVQEDTSEDEQGNLRTETRILSSATLPAGSEATVSSGDIDNFAQEPGRKPVVRSIELEIKDQEWYLENKQADQTYLEAVQADLEQQLADLESRGLLEKFLGQFTDISSQEELLKEIMLQVETQLEEMGALPDEETPGEGEDEEGDEDSGDQDEGEGEGEGTGDSGQTPTNPDREHVVQSGDTLTGIASRYGISVEDIMRANGLTNANYLSIGQELIIPSDTSNLPPLETPTVSPGVHTGGSSGGGSSSGGSSGGDSQDTSGQDTHVEDDEPFQSPIS